jgi:hypothetical protein
MKYDYQRFEESLEILLARDVIQEWRGLGPGHYRINGELDVWPKNGNYHNLMTDEHGRFSRLEELLEDYTYGGVYSDVHCPYCGKLAAWIPNEQVYGKRYGKSYMCYYCAPCDAYVGCHNNTRKPLGVMANKELRGWRMQAHKAVDPLWKSGRYKRGVVYAKLSDAFKRPIHIGESDIAICKAVIERVPIIFNH